MTSTATRPPRLAKPAPTTRPTGYLVLRCRAASLLLHRRTAVAVTVLLLALAAGCVASLSLGSSTVPPLDAVRSVLGLTDEHAFVIGVLRLPRLTVALLVGAALAVAGGLIQTVARNPLASPDIIGVSQGAAAVAVIAMTYGLGGTGVLPYWATAGGLAAAVLVYLFAWRGGLHAGRFVLIGIGFAIALRSVTQLFLTKGDHTVAQQATVWMTGSFNGRGYAEAAPLAWALLALLPAVCWAARAQRSVSLDDDTATALGVRINATRVGLVAVGVLLAALATGTAGPVDFVALLSPQIARRLTRTAQIPLLATALVGALLTVLADLLARLLFAPTELPAGVVTAAIGAPYLLWLIFNNRAGGRA
ncbi:iron ABC transporter permease [Streptomyces sp. DSM 44915]|uniref:Iron ABC transporter permease n=1 Tax=Streptomyces chisholmiae TaxID=3075540 RepID=A0ABU2JT25_9ACTN|nr:iron ABC transporter permease [Streptomyces sp. DSM 44915]MDT0268139.1 iron ABC transporter permease [Streptomyces sp. DSM 44915]